MEEEAKTDVMTSSVTSGDSVTTTSSDNESWTILDEDEAVAEEATEALVLNARVDVVEEVALFSKREAPHPETDSDIETIDQHHDDEDEVDNARIQGEENLESLTSDGIPVVDEYQDHDGEEGHQQQYLWSSESSELMTTSAETETAKTPEEDDEDDLEIIDKAEGETEPVKHSDSLCPSGYPPHELPDSFSKIVKGRTYTHRPNQRLNVYLTSAVVLVVALVVGLGVGHFKGWSERLELQEQYADVREERLSELTDSLVSCMTGVEGQGGEDQDLDERVIRQLSEENEKLKEELAALKAEFVHNDNQATEEMSAILRDRINDLLLANSDLEKEVARLRYSHAAISDAEVTRVGLQQARESLNIVANENDQLKLAIARERYGIRQAPIEEREKMNVLQTENEELKTEVRKFRYGVFEPELEAVLPEVPDFAEPLIPDFEDIDEGFGEFRNDTFYEDFDVSPDYDDDEFEFVETEEEIEEPNPNFVTLTKPQPVLPPVILLGSARKINDVEEQQHEKIPTDVQAHDGVQVQVVPPSDVSVIQDLDHKPVVQEFSEDEGFVEIEDDDDDEDDVESDHDEQEEEEEEELRDSFKTFMDLMAGKKLNKKAGDYVAKVGAVIDAFKQSATEILPEKSEIKASAEKLSSVLKDRWDELDLIKEKKKAAKLVETLFGALKRVKKAVNEEFAEDAKIWSNRFDRVHAGFQDKWQQVVDRFQQPQKPESKKKRKEHPVKSEPECPEKTKVKPDHQHKDKEHKKKSLNPKNATSSWIFHRAQSRDKTRKDEVKADWLFDRASNRKKFHNLATSDWQSRRVYAKDCDGDHCEDLDMLNAAAVNHGSKKKKLYKGDNDDDNTASSKKNKPTMGFNFEFKYDTRTYKQNTFSKDDYKKGFDGLYVNKNRFNRGYEDYFDDRDDLDDDDDEEEDELESVIRLEHRHGHGGSRVNHPHAKKKFVYKQKMEAKSKKTEKRSRFQHRNSNHNHQRKPFLHQFDSKVFH